MKSLTSFISFCFLSFYLFAQSSDTRLANDYLDSAEVLTTNKDYAEALHLRKKALQIYNNLEPVNDSLSIYAQMSIGYTHLVQLNYDTAFFSFYQILKNYQHLNDTFPFAMKVYSYLATISTRMGNTEKALYYANKAVSLAIYNRYNYLTLVQSYKIISNLYIRQDKTQLAKEAVKKGISICEENPECQNKLTYVSLLSSAGMIHNKLQLHDRALDYYHLGIKFLDQLPDDIPKNYPLIYGNIGSVYRDINDFKQSLKWYKMAIEATHNTKTRWGTLGTAIWLEKIGLLQLNNNDPHRAILYFEQAIAARKGTFQENTVFQAGTYHLLGKAHNALGNYAKAIEYIKFSQTVFEENAAKKKTAAIGQKRDLSYAHKNIGEYKLSEQYLQEILDVQLHDKNLDVNQIAKTHISLAQLFEEQEQYVRSRNHYQQALSYNKEFYRDRESWYWSIYKYLGRVSSSLGQIDSAETYYNLALNALELNSALPEKIIHTKQIRALVEIQYAKAELRITQYHHFKDSIELLRHAWIHNEIALEQYVNLYEQCELGRCDHGLKPSFREVLDQAFQIYFLLKEKTDAHISLEKLFYFLEKSKSSFMRERFLEVEAQSFAALPEAISNKIYDTNVKIAHYEKKLYEQQFLVENSQDSLAERFKSRLFHLRQTSDSITASLKERYPNYYKIKYANDIRSIEDIQSELSSEETLVEYFVGDSNAYAFVIRQNNSMIEEISLNFDLASSITELRNSIYSYWMNSKYSDEKYLDNKVSYSKEAHLLFTKFIKPFESNLAKKLIIIPDGPLHYVPFDALTTQEHDSTDDFRQYAYLINRHQISSDYSATLWYDLKNNTKSNPHKTMLCMSPKFQSDTISHDDLISLRSGLNALEYNVTETMAIKEIYGADVVTGDLATTSYFLTHANQYRMLHLSTHGKANDNMGDFSYIAFSETNDTSDKDNLLYVRDLYNLKLNADLVVLSACETGLGELQEGEGIIGMARGFTYAGAASTVTSLWSVDDAQTSELMKSFYTYLNQGMQKDAALRQAKLDHLAFGAQPDPYFWAGFIASGNMEPISLNTKWKKISYILFPLILVLLCWGVIRMR